ncbi:tripartite tricarboxylate transporter substrate-binding protein [Reyranella sp.]|uniref:tripartite tricarboxylate transporter substrate-binding protein n=1 Tax=Reyranella sp. TaxID=1929291 RepID=UPI00271A4896|nr:tripartite tricarboxylate transporter substrate-binding protein [Reyranella sp.]MDO8972771.1 tripartite tricarboxylate transporter substrate-binding protein [Reyranella sp.]
MNFATVLTVLFSALFWTSAGAAASAQSRPNGPLQIIVPYSPGSVADSLARVIAAELREHRRQPVIVVGRPAGGALAAAEAFTRADADGSKLLLVTASHVIPSTSRKTPYDPLNDFVPVATIASNEFVLVANPSLRASNLQELIALAMEKPGRLNFGSAGEFSASHLAGALFNARAGVSINHVPYKGAAPALVDLLGGHLDLSFQGPLAVLSLIREGRLKALGYGGERRSKVLPDVPTFAEGGVGGYQLKIWFGLLAPPRTPQDVADRLSAEIAKILAKPAIDRQLAEQGMETLVSDSRQFAALMKADKDRFDALLKSTDINLGR